jgi:hypothetical protein
MTFLPKDFTAKQFRGASIQGIAKGAKLRGVGGEAQRPAVVEIPRDRYKSDLEREFAAHLEILRAAGELSFWDYECVKIRLADGTWYTADFLVKLKDQIIIYETKGFMREAARVRVNVAATRVPIPIFVVTKEGGSWRYSLKPGQ